MAYSYFQFIAYEVPTASEGQNQTVRSGFDPGPECADVPRIPVGNATPDDARKRLKRLASVVDLAEQLVPRGANEKTDTLKIFMAPEFYFRPKQYDDRYKYNVYPEPHAEAIFDQLSTMFTDSAFKNWLVVAGTVLWKYTWHNPTTNKFQAFYRNTAVAVRGQEIYGFEKDLPSGIDGVPEPYSQHKSVRGDYNKALKRAYEHWSLRRSRTRLFFYWI
jgi:hypothetical protein